jgi:hypothetical protein
MSLTTGIEIDEILDRHDQSGLRPRDDVLMTSRHIPAVSASAESHRLLENRPSRDRLFLDLDVEGFALDRRWVNRPAAISMLDR